MYGNFERILNMQLLTDLLPIILFFAVYSVYGSIYVATAVLMAMMAILIGVQWIRHRTVSRMLLISGGLVLLLGGATLILRRPIFVQWKPTIANWAFAVAFIGSRYIGDKTLLERAMGDAIDLPAHIWHQLNWVWVANFVLLGAANLYVVYNYSEPTWVKFKLASIIASIVFCLLITIARIWKYLPEQPQKES
jgi:intracellular septation protein